MDIERFPNSSLAQISASSYLSKILKDRAMNPVLLLLSGGSALSIPNGIQEDLLSSQITISVLDERYSKDLMVNNFSQIMNTDFFKKAERRNCNFIDTRIHDKETMEALAERFEEELQNWKNEHKKGKIIATFGVGIDGHTAGIMPYPESPKYFENVFENDTRWVVSYDAGEKSPQKFRITTTIPFLKQIDYAVCYMVGEKKRTAFEKIISEVGSMEETPARVLREIHDSVIVTDL